MLLYADTETGTTHAHGVIHVLHSYVGRPDRGPRTHADGLGGLDIAPVGDEAVDAPS